MATGHSIPHSDMLPQGPPLANMPKSLLISELFPGMVTPLL